MIDRLAELPSVVRSYSTVLLYVLIPLTSGLVGWITNVIALKMTFYPIKFRGIPPYLGWQGVVPRKARKIARKSVAVVTEKLLTVEDVFGKIDSRQLAREMEPSFEDLIEPRIREVLERNTPTVWETVPPDLKRRLFDRLQEHLPALIASLLSNPESIETRENADDELRQEVEQALEDSLGPGVDDILRRTSPTLWESVPLAAREHVFREIRNRLPELLTEVFEDWQEEIDEIFNLRRMVVDELTDQREVINRIFQETGNVELKFIEHCGFLFGFLFGTVQMIWWFYSGSWWILPLAGFFVGTMTNWIAIRMLFYPKTPVEIGSWSIQGFAFKRRSRIIDSWTNIVVNEILRTDKIFDYIFRGESRKTIKEILRRNVHAQVDSIGGVFNPVLRNVLGPDRYLEIKEQLCDEMLSVLPEVLKHSYDYVEERMNLRETLRRDLHELPPEEYEAILRTPFQEDEWILVAFGGALGTLAGVLQLTLLFGGSIPLLF